MLRFVLDDLPRRLGRPVSFHIVSGTSVGAIHACYVAATAHLTEGRGKRLSEIWERFRLEEMLPLSAMDLLRVPQRLLGLRRFASEMRANKRLPDRLFGAFRTDVLEKIVLHEIPWRDIHRNVRAGRIDAACVTATEIATGHPVVFIPPRTTVPPRWTRDRP